MAIGAGWPLFSIVDHCFSIPALYFLKAEQELEIVVFEEHLHPADLPLFSKDLELCEHIFDIVCSEGGFTPRSCQSDLVACHLIYAFKEGIRDAVQLLMVARMAAMVDREGRRTSKMH